MKTRELLTAEQREYFYGVPEHMDEREILRYYTISDEELQIITKQRGAANRLVFAIQIAYLRFPGRPLSANEKVPDFIVHTIAKQLRILPSAIQNYARGRDATRREHLIKIRNTLGFLTFTLKEYRELARWLLPMAMKTDQGHLLVEALITEMRKRKIILPAIYAVEHLAWAVRERAHRRIFKQLTKNLTSSQCKQLDKLLSVGKGYKYSYLSWLRQPSGVVSVKNFHKVSLYLAPENFENIKVKRDQYKELIFKVIQDGIESGEFRKELPIPIISMAIFGMVNWIYKWYHKAGLLEVFSFRKESFLVDGEEAIFY